MLVKPEKKKSEEEVKSTIWFDFGLNCVKFSFLYNVHHLTFKIINIL